MIGSFKTVNMAWINKIAMSGYTWLFVYESARRYEGRMNAAPVLKLSVVGNKLYRWYSCLHSDECRTSNKLVPKLARFAQLPSHCPQMAACNEG